MPQRCRHFESVFFHTRLRNVPVPYIILRCWGHTSSHLGVAPSMSATSAAQVTVDKTDGTRPVQLRGRTENVSRGAQGRLPVRFRKMMRAQQLQ